MYVVANLTGNEVSISDLNIGIPPRSGRDLDVLHLTCDPRSSIDLKTALKKRLLKVIKNDEEPTSRKPKKEVIREKEVVKEKTIIKEVPSGIDQKVLMDFIRQEIKNAQQSPVVVQKERDKYSEPVLRAIMEKVDKILQQKSSHSGQNLEEESDEDIDPKLLAEMHKKRVNKIVENAENKIEYQTEKTDDTFMDEDIDELSDLL